MLTRLCLCLLVACASSTVSARDLTYSPANGESCPESAAEVGVAAKGKLRPARSTAPVREAKSRPAVHGDSATRPSQRWHSFLPGMFR